MEINLSGEREHKKVERCYVPTRAYIGKVKKISEVYKVEDYKEKGIMREKLRIVVEVNYNNKPAQVSWFVQAKVYKANDPKFSNSHLYNFLNIAGLFAEFEKVATSITALSNDEANDVFVKWLREKTIGREVEVLTKERKSIDGEKYSAIDKVIRFTDVPEVEEVK